MIDFEINRKGVYGQMCIRDSSKPQWWNSNVTRYFLGDYSDKKYRLFIAVTGKTEIDVANEEELRYYTLLLKYHLLAEKEAGRTVYEDDGKEMTVAYLPG